MTSVGFGRIEEIRERVLHGNLVRTLLWLAWPVMVVNLVNVSYNIVDAIWLGRLGRQAFSAPTVCMFPIMLIYSAVMGYAMAGISLISQYVGAKDLTMTKRVAGQLLTFGLIVGISTSLVGYFVAPYILSAMGVPSDVYPLALSYLRIMFLGMPLIIPGFGYVVIANSLGDTRTPMKLNVATSLANIVLDPILIFGLLGMPKLGVVGAALATVASRSAATVAGIVLLFRGFSGGFRIHLSDMKLEGWWLRKVFKIGTPLAIQQSSNALGFTILMSIVSRFGSAYIAAFGVVSRVTSLIQVFTGGINRAGSIIVGQSVGAEAYERAKEAAHKVMLITFTSLSIGAAVIYLLRAWVVQAFVNDPAVIPIGSQLITYMAPAMPFFGLFAVCGAVASGSGHTKFYAVISVIRLWLVRIGLSILLAYLLGWGALGVWVAMAVSNVVAGIASATWVVKGSWLKRVIETPKPITKVALSSTRST